MTSVDKRIVQMDFDNKSFEKGVNQTIKDLEKLEKKMNFNDMGKSFSKLEAMANTIKLDGIKDAVESINDKFSVMGVVAFNVISRITNAALDMFSQISAATLGSIFEGGSTRALNLEQAMFQFEGLGMDVAATMEDVSYAVDGTAYSLDAAAKVAAQLGASGMRAGDEMKSSLRGISGVAAMTGSSYEDIGNVFTKIAGQGRVMGDDLLRLSARGINAAATLATAMGKSEAEVRDMVTKGQISFQMFSDAMSQAFGEHATRANETFTGAMSNVKSALGRIGAKFFTPFYENARDVLNAIRPKINELSTALDPAFKLMEIGMSRISGLIQDLLSKIDFSGFTSMLTELSKAVARVFQIGEDSGGAIEAGPLHVVYAMKRVVDGMVNIFNTLKNLFVPMAEAFRNVFPIDGVKVLTDFTLKFELLTQRFKIGEKQVDSIRASFTTFFTIVKNVATVVGSTLAGAFKILQPILGIVSKVFGYIATAIGGFAEAIYAGTPAAEIFADVIDKVSTKIAGFFTAIQNGMPSVESFSGVVDNIKNKFQELSGSLSGKIPAVLEAIGNGFKTLASWAGRAWEAVGNFVSNIDWNTVFLGGISIGSGVGIFGMLKNLIGTLGEVKGIASGFSSFIENLSGPLEQLSGILESYQQNIQASAIIKIAGAIGILAASLLILSTINPAGLASGIAAMGALMAELTVMIGVLNKMNPAKMTSVSVSLVVMSAALLVLSAAMKNLGSMSWEEIGKGTVALLVLSGVLIGLTAALNAIKSRAIGGAMSMIVIGAALLVLSQALKSLGEIDQGVLIQGFIAMTAVLLVLTTALNFMKSSVGGAVSMVIIAAALIVLTQALKQLGELPLEQLVQGGIAIAAMLAALVVAVNLMSNGLAGAAAILIISAALVVLTAVLWALGSMDMNTLIQGLVAFVAVLATFTVVTLILAQFAPQVLAVSAALVIFSVGLLIAAAAIVVMGVGLNLLVAAGWPAIGMLATLGVALIPLAVLSPLLFLFGAGMLAFGVGLVAAGAGLLLFSLAGPQATIVLTSLAIAMIPLLAAAPAMAIVGAAMITLGAGALIMGAGLVVLSLGFTMLNSSLPMGIPLLQRLAEVALEIAPAAVLFATLGAELLVLGAGALAAGAGLLVLGVGLLITAAAIAVFSMAVTGSFLDAVSIFDEAMGTFVWHTPGMIAAGAALLAFGAGVLVAGAGALVAAAGFVLLEAAILLFTVTYPKMETAMNKFVTVAEKLNTISPALISVSETIATMSSSMTSFGMGIALAAAGTTTLAAGVQTLSTNIAMAMTSTNAGATIITTAMTSMVTSVSSGLTTLTARYTVFSTNVQTSMNLVAVTMTAGSTRLKAIMTGMVSSIASSVNLISSQFARLGPSIASGVNQAVPAAQQAGRNIVMGAINGMGSMMSAVYARGAEVGRQAVAGVNAGAGNASPSKITTKSGINIGQGAINGMIQMGKSVYAAGYRLGHSATDGVDNGLNLDGILMGDMNPVITPVVDLSNVQTAINTINSSFGGNGIGINGLSPVAPAGGTVIQNNYYIDGIELNDLANNADYTIQEIFNLRRVQGRA